MASAPDAPADLVLRARRVMLPGGPVPATVVVTDGKISAIRDGGPDDADCVQLGDDEVLLPGLVDTHVHVNEPGRTQWEGFVTATAAAAAGGVTTLVDMPLNCLPPTTDAAALAGKRAAAREKCQVDVGFWGGLVPGNDAERAGLHDAGVLGFKCFLVDSGVPEFPPLSAPELEYAAAQLSALGSLLLVHAEDAVCIGAAPAAAGRDYRRFLASRPGDAETTAVATVIDVVRRTGVRAHILHVSSAGVLPLLAAARADGLPVTAETCPHYLALAAEDVHDGATVFKCCPPIRDAANREQLWAGLRAGIIDCVVSDHSPCPPELKRPETGDFGAAWGGIASLQLALPVTWTAGRERGCTLSDVTGWLAAAPARIAGLSGKGTIAVGHDADLVAFAPDEDFVVDPVRLRHRHPLTPYAGKRLTGVVRRTWLRGRLAYDASCDNVAAASSAARGRLLTRLGRDD
jgi:allantoinase